MIGKDMTKMTLPVSFNEPTSLLQRVTEDMVCAFLYSHFLSKNTRSMPQLGQQDHFSRAGLVVTPILHISCEPDHSLENRYANI